MINENITELQHCESTTGLSDKLVLLLLIVIIEALHTSHTKAFLIHHRPSQWSKNRHRTLIQLHSWGVDQSNNTKLVLRMIYVYRTNLFTIWVGCRVLMHYLMCVYLPFYNRMFRHWHRIHQYIEGCHGVLPCTHIVYIPGLRLTECTCISCDILLHT